MSLLTIGVFGTSSKKQEKRVPIHPDQLDAVDESVRGQLYFEAGYGLAFGWDDDQLATMCAGIRSRAQLLEQCDVALLAKPVHKDFEDMNEGTIHWGWPHCVQQRDITQTAIDSKLTLIAWEAMHGWSAEGKWQFHTFQKNNEIAGYAGVQHAMNLRGIDGNYGPDLKAVIISHGSVSRGAIRGLQVRGITDITVYTPHASPVANQIEGVNYAHFKLEAGQVMALTTDGFSRPFAGALSDADIIVNGILQDTDHPLMFVPEGQGGLLKAGCLIVDISCDEGMGFYFAKPTSFDAPTFQVGKVSYYAVDHTPSYLWNAATWEISKGVIQHLRTIIGGPEAWDKDETIRRAIEIKDGVIQNPKISSFQKRSSEYPHPEL